MFLRLGALFLAAALAVSSALGFLGLGVQPPRPDLALMVFSSGNISVLRTTPWMAIFPGLVLTLNTATWLVVAALLARSGQEYRPVGWAHTIS